MKQVARNGLSVLGWALAAGAFAQDSSDEVRRIEHAFIDAQDLVVVNRKVDVPSDVVARIAMWDYLAEFGEIWNTGDRISLDEKHGQFVFAGISENFAAVVIRSGESQTQLILAERRKPGLCRFYLGREVPDVLERLRSAIEQGGISRNGVRVGCFYVAAG